MIHIEGYTTDIYTGVPMYLSSCRCPHCKFLLDFDDAYAQMDEAYDLKSILTDKTIAKIQYSTRLDQLHNRLHHIVTLHPMITASKQYAFNFEQTLQ